METKRVLKLEQTKIFLIQKHHLWYLNSHSWKRFPYTPITIKHSRSPRGNLLFCFCFLLSKNRMHNEVWGSMEILPIRELAATDFRTSSEVCQGPKYVSEIPTSLMFRRL